MKRDLDLARQLLLEIENRGTDCSVSVLRSGSSSQSEEQVRYHLRLLIDAELLKEIDRTSAGIPCVRLTHDGHELLELARIESRWREAKYACQERLGGLSLAVIRGILTRWAIAATARVPRHYRAPVNRRMRYESDPSRERPAYRVEPYRAAERLIDRDYIEADDQRHDYYENARYVNVRPEVDEYRHRSTRYGIEPRYGVDLDGDGRIDLEIDPTLPGYLI